MQVQYQNFVVRPWQTGDRQSVAEVIGSVLAEYGLAWEPTGADRDVLAVEEYYQSRGGEFWVVEQGEKLVGTGAYYPIARGKKAAEIRKMYLLPEARGLGLGQFLLQHLEATIAAQNFAEIWIETLRRQWLPTREWGRDDSLRSRLRQVSQVGNLSQGLEAIEMLVCIDR
jgi:putative acetyltransferase